MKRLLLAAALLASPAAACDKADEYAGQFAAENALGRPLFDFEGMTPAQLGALHWRVRTKLIPWAARIADPCIRSEASDYLRVELSDAEEKASEPPEERDHEAAFQAAGRGKLSRAILPPLP
jgi:hypothetical protein